MKITKTQLKQIIREEVGLLQEGLSPLSDPASALAKALWILNEVPRTGEKREDAIRRMEAVLLDKTTDAKSFKAAVEWMEAAWERRKPGSSWIRKT